MSRSGPRRTSSCPPPPPFPRPDAPTLKFSALVPEGFSFPEPQTAFLSDAGGDAPLPTPLRYPVPAGRYRHLGVTLLRSLAAGENLTISLVKNAAPVVGASVTFTGPIAALTTTLHATFAPADYNGTTDTLDVQTSTTNLASPAGVSATVSGEA